MSSGCVKLSIENVGITHILIEATYTLIGHEYENKSNF